MHIVKQHREFYIIKNTFCHYYYYYYYYYYHYYHYYYYWYYFHYYYYYYFYPYFKCLKLMKYLARSFKIQRKRFLENTFIVMNPFALQGPGDLTDLGSTREECIRSCGTKLICFNQIIVLPSPSSYYSTPSLEQKEFKICSYSENQKIIAFFFFRIMKCCCRIL